MTEELRQLHLKAGFNCGRELTCRDKIKYKSEEKADKSAKVLSDKYNKEMEAYPCAFCNGWHIGRKMSMEELIKYSSFNEI